MLPLHLGEDCEALNLQQRRKNPRSRAEKNPGLQRFVIKNNNNNNSQKHNI